MKSSILAVTLILIGAFIFPIAWDRPVVHAQTADPVITPSLIVEELLKKKKENPRISARSLAVFGNSLIKARGYDFSFYACEIAEANEEIANNRDNTSGLQAYLYKMKRSETGKERFYRIMSGEFSLPCGCGFAIPIYSLSDKEMTVRADNASVRLVRSKEFVLDTVELVDKTRKKVLRKWEMPYDGIPLGISRDGTKIYIETGYDDQRLNELVLEISTNGTVRHVLRKDPNIIQKSVDLERLPGQEPEVGYKRFTDAGRSYAVKFYYPCT